MVNVPLQVIADARAADVSLWPILVAIAKYESAYEPSAKGDYKTERGGVIVPRTTAGAFPTSFGYLQIHTDGGLGDGLSESRLLNGPYNMAVGAGQIRYELSQGKTLYQAIRFWSTRDAAWALYRQMVREGVNDRPIDAAQGDPQRGLVPILLSLGVLLILGTI